MFLLKGGLGATCLAQLDYQIDFAYIMNNFVGLVVLKKPYVH